MSAPFDTADVVDDQEYEYEREMPAFQDPAEVSQLPEPICALQAPPSEPIHWIVQDLFTSGDVGLVVGDGGSFKSSAALHIAAAVAGGNKAFGRFETVGPAPVLICSAEDPGAVIQMRLEAFVRGHDWSRINTLMNVHYFALAGIRLKDARWKRHLVDVVDRIEPAMVVLDPFVDLSGLEEENSNSEASTIMGYARELARRSQAAIVFVHHANKAGEGRTQSRIRGAGSIANASRGTLFFEFTEAGVLVEQLKMTYAEKIPPFMLERHIESQPTNKAVWISARLSTVKPETARLSRAEEFVLNQIKQSPGVLNSRGLRSASNGSGIWASDIDKAIKSLFGKHLIYAENGKGTSKLWHPAPQRNDTSEDESVRPEGQFGTLTTQRPERAGGGTGHSNSPAERVPPLRGGRDTRSEAALADTPPAVLGPEEFDETQAISEDS